MPRDRMVLDVNLCGGSKIQMRTCCQILTAFGVESTDHHPHQDYSESVMVGKCDSKLY